MGDPQVTNKNKGDWQVTKKKKGDPQVTGKKKGRLATDWEESRETGK